MEWKTALYDFMHNRNETELHYNPVHIAANVSDERFLEAELARQARRGELARSRGLEPLRCETRLRLHKAELREGTLWASVDWLRLSEYRLGPTVHREEQAVRERIGLAQANGRWLVRQVEPAEACEGAEAVKPPAPDVQAAAPLGMPDSLAGAPERLAGGPVSPELEPSGETRRIPYNRQLAKQYADRWWNSANPEYLHFEVDCSNFVSQCLFAGRAPMDYTGKRDAGWWYRGKMNGSEHWSFSWAVANSLRLYLESGRGSGLRAVRVDAPDRLAIGDVISYSFDGSGRFGHSTIVTAFDAGGMPLVNAHTVNSRGRYWDYKDSYAWTERTMYRFFHIADEF